MRLPVAARYALGTAGCVGIAWGLRPWGLVALWPAISLAVMTAAYLGAGPGLFRKAAGRLPITIWLLMGPWLLGFRLTMRAFARRSSAYVEIAPGLVMGRKLNAREAEELRRDGVTAVLDLTAEIDETAVFRAMDYRNIPLLDLVAPLPERLAEAVEFIRERQKAGRVYVHCALGFSRSVCVAAAWLLAEGLAPSAEEAVARVRAVRQQAVVTPEMTGAIARSLTFIAIRQPDRNKLVNLLPCVSDDEDRSSRSSVTIHVTPVGARGPHDQSNPPTPASSAP